MEIPRADVTADPRVMEESLTGDAAQARLREEGNFESLSQAFHAARYGAEKLDPESEYARGADYFASNPKQQLRAWFGKNGVELASGIEAPEGRDPWNVKVRLHHVGRGGSVVSNNPRDAGRTVSSAGSRIEITDAVSGVTEWFENRTEGLEQGFTIQQAPAAGNGPLEVVLGPSGNTSVSEITTDGGPGVCFLDSDGSPVVGYEGLKAWDATGRELVSRMEARGGKLTLQVEDGGAVYPVTVDPLFVNVETRLIEESVAGDQFGMAVALSGDTALVGAPGDDTVAGQEAGSAYVFVRTGTVWNQQAKLLASDAAGADLFGSALAVFADTAVIGARFDDTDQADTGSAYVFVRSGTTWTQQTKLLADDRESADNFGVSVDLDGETAVIGASRDDVAAGADVGSAYVFLRSGTTWSQQTKLVATDGAAGDEFGVSVALSGDTAVVGAHLDDSAAGSAYVFFRSGTTWSQQQKLAAGDAAGGDRFGVSVAVSGSTALVGANRHDTLAGGTDAGSSYVFQRSGGVWSQQAELTASDGASNDGFGISVALVGNTALVGAFTDDTVAGVDAGSAYVYVRSAGTWTQQAQLLASDGAGSDRFGGNVALSGDTALVGALGNDTGAGTLSGSAYVFVTNGSSWLPQMKLYADDDPAEDRFGLSVALSGNTALVGAWMDDTAIGSEVGSAYVFVRGASGWSQQAKLTANDGATGDAFGFSVALSGDSALIGANGDNKTGASDSGSAYVLVRIGTTWSQQAKLIASDGAEGDSFGNSVALDTDTALIGASSKDTPAGVDAGGAYVFTRTGTSWSEQAELTAGDGETGDSFGLRVALSGDSALIGAPLDNNAAGADAGGAYVFLRSGTVWSEQMKLTAAAAAAGDQFGFSVAIEDDTAIVGAWQDDTAGGISAGSAFVFVRQSAAWSVQAKLVDAGGGEFDHFGVSVALSGDTALVGANGDDSMLGSDVGSAHVYSREGLTWRQQGRIGNGVDASAGDGFGDSVALSGKIALVGASSDDTNGTDSGSVYVFVLGELPQIVTQPLSQTVLPGTLVTFGVTATGEAPLRFQWRRNGFDMAGENSNSISIQVPETSPFDTVEGTYDVVVSNGGGVVVSNQAVLDVNALSEFTQTFPDAPPDAQGFVLVTLTPAGVGGWRFEGEQRWIASGVPVGGLATGDRVIEFQPVPGYIQPPSETVGIVSGGAASLVDRTYYDTPTTGSGALSVTLKPDDIAAAGVDEADRAQWRILSGSDTTWRDSGTTLGELIPGYYLVECKPVPGRTTPAPINVLIEDGVTTLSVITYFLEDPAVGTLPDLLSFEDVTTDTTMPYAYVGQIRSSAGSSSGFVVKQRVVATAGHVVFDDGTLAAVGDLQWLFQRHSRVFEPKPLVPRGFYLFDDYAALREAEGTPGSSSPASQDRDAAAMYFLEDAGRAGYSGYLASDAAENEFLLSSSFKTLVGYPVDGITPADQGRMHATTPFDVVFTHATGTTYTTSGISSSGGGSGGPLCVQFEDGTYYPAAIYLGGSGQTVVRAIDSEAIDLFDRAEVSGTGGDNNTGGGITHSSFSSVGSAGDPGAVEVTIQPAGARNAGAGWRLKPETSYRPSGNQKAGLTAGSYILQLNTVSGYDAPSNQNITVNAGQLSEITFTYQVENTAPTISNVTNFHIDEDTSSGAISVTVSDAESSNGSLDLTGTSSNTSLIPNSNIVFGGSGSNRTVTVTPSANQNGSAVITLTVSDGELTDSDNFTVTVDPVNDVPTITSISAQSIPVNTSTGAISFTISDIETAASSLTLSKTTTNATLVPTSNIAFSGSGASRNVTITPTANQLGSASVTVTVSDGDLTANRKFTVTVTGTAIQTWRFANFGTTADTGSTANTADADGDGSTNLDEYAAGTDPNSPADLFKVLTITRSVGTCTLTATGKSSRSYTLERRDSLDSGPWLDVSSVGPLVTDGPITLTDSSAPANSSFYRIRVTAP